MLLHPIWNYLFIEVCEMRLIGAAFAFIFSFLVNFILLHLLIRKEKSICEAFGLPTKDSFRGTKEYLKIGIPSMLMWCLKSWCFQIQILISSLLGTEIVAA